MLYYLLLPRLVVQSVCCDGVAKVEGLPMVPRNSEQWLRLLRRAVDSPEVVDPAELLVMRDVAGRSQRLQKPPTGILPRAGAVLLLCYPQGDDVLLPLTRRSEELATHPGQVSLPGGSIDPADDGPVAAALREASEEIGLDSRAVAVWGTLEQVYIPPSNFWIRPVVAVMPAAPRLLINPAEVAEVLTISLAQLLDPATLVVEQWSWPEGEFLVPFYAVGGHKVWGATAMVLSELAARLRRALKEAP